MSSALLYALGRLLSPEDTSLSDIAVSPHLTARLVSAPATEDDGQDSSDAQPEGRGGSPLASAPALASLEDEIGSLNSRIRKTRDYCWQLGCILPREPARIVRTGTLTGSAPSKPPTTPDQASQAFPRELRLGGATLRLTSDGRLKVSGVRIPDPHENAFVPDARDGSIWIEALLAWCQKYQGLSPGRRDAYDGVAPDEVAAASQKLQEWLTDPAAAAPQPRGCVQPHSRTTSPSASRAVRRSLAADCRWWSVRSELGMPPSAPSPMPSQQPETIHTDLDAELGPGSPRSVSSFRSSSSVSALSTVRASASQPGVQTASLPWP